MSDIAKRKSDIRTRVWNKLEELDVLKDYPRPCHNKIPHFKGCEFAAERVTRLREFARARVVKINPSLAQMKLRFFTLDSGKTLLVPSPALVRQNYNTPQNDEVFFYKIDGRKLSNSSFRAKTLPWTKAGAAKYGEPLLLDWSSVNKIDLVVVASVAVSVNGVRLGKGLGYAELEWGILVELGVVSDKTIVITTVHEDQIVDDLTEEMMMEYDLPVDIIVTPNRIINVRNKLKKPMCGVLWDQVSKEKIEEIPILRLLKRKQ